MQQFRSFSPKLKASVAVRLTPLALPTVCARLTPTFCQLHFSLSAFRYLDSRHAQSASHIPAMKSMHLLASSLYMLCCAMHILPFSGQPTDKLTYMEA